MKRLLVYLLIIWSSVILAHGAAVPVETTVKVKNVLKRVAPSMVKVIAESEKVYVGTGIVIKRDLVLTSAILARSPEARLTVVDTEKRRYPARIKGVDPETSVALLELDSGSLKPIQMSDSLEVGDWVALVGAFYEQFPAIQQGMVSSVNNDAIIINAAAVPGSAGGAVVNEDGRLVAVIRGRFGFAMAPDLLLRENSGEMVFRSSKSRGGELCFAVPSLRVREVSAQLERFGSVRRGWLGLYLSWSRPDNTVRVTRVVEGSPAYRGGLRADDRILSVNGKAVSAIADVSGAVRDLAPGAELKVEVQRDRVRKTLLMTMGSRSDSAKRVNYSFWKSVPSPRDGTDIALDFHETLPRFHRFIIQSGREPSLGIEFRSLSRTGNGNRQGTEQTNGLIVTGVLRESPAAVAGLRRGDHLISIGGKRISSPEDVRRAVLEKKNEGKVELIIQRDGGMKKIDLLIDPVEGNDFAWNRFRDQMKGMSVEIYDRSLQGIQREIERLKWRMELLERQLQKSNPEDLKRMIDGFEWLKSRTAEVLKHREAQLKSTRKALNENFRKIGRRLEEIEKKVKRRDH